VTKVAHEGNNLAPK
jgi:hypothetical protein